MNSIARWSAAGVAVVVGALIVLMATAPDNPNEETVSPLVGRTAPAIVSVDTEGQEFRLDDYEGSWVLLNFFATWCVPCVREHPELVAFSERHAAIGDAAVVSVAFDDSPESIAEFFDDNGGDWQVVADDRVDPAVEAAGGTDLHGGVAPKISLDYGVVKLPESYLISPEGVVVHKFVGGIRAAEVEAEIARASGVGGGASGGAAGEDGS